MDERSPATDSQLVEWTGKKNVDEENNANVVPCKRKPLNGNHHASSYGTLPFHPGL